MRYEVPQFIDVQDKIFGPLTISQFLYLLGAGGGAYIAKKVLIAPLGILVGIVFIMIGVTLAFFPYNGRPMIATVEAFFFYHMAPKLYVWSHRKDDEKEKNPSKELPKQASDTSILSKQEPVSPSKKLTRTQLRDLAQGLDVRDTRS